MAGSGFKGKESLVWSQATCWGVYIHHLGKKFPKNEIPHNIWLSWVWIFPGGKVLSKCQRRRCRRHRFHPWAGKTPWRRKWQPIPVFLYEKPHEQRSLAGYSPWSCKELGMTRTALQSYIWRKTVRNEGPCYTGGHLAKWERGKRWHTQQSWSGMVEELRLSWRHFLGQVQRLTSEHRGEGK